MDRANHLWDAVAGMCHDVAEVMADGSTEQDLKRLQTSIQTVETER